MSYKRSFHAYQQEYAVRYPAALRMRELLPDLHGKDVLDVGCGSGMDLSFMAAQHPRYLAGTDISKDLTAIAREQAPSADIRNDSFDYLSWKEDSFDLVWSRYALNCATDISNPLKEIWRVCRPGGAALIQVTHPMKSMSLLDEPDYYARGESFRYPLDDGRSLTEPHHLFEDWINAIAESGFRIMRCEETLNRPASEYRSPVMPSAIIFELLKD